MPAKKVSLGRKQGLPETPIGIEEWVTNREDVQAASQPKENKDEKMKRLTLDLPEGLHRAIKRKAVEEGVTMARAVAILA